MLEITGLDCIRSPGQSHRVAKRSETICRLCASPWYLEHSMKSTNPVWMKGQKTEGECWGEAEAEERETGKLVLCIRAFQEKKNEWNPVPWLFPPEPQETQEWTWNFKVRQKDVYQRNWTLTLDSLEIKSYSFRCISLNQGQMKLHLSCLVNKMCVWKPLMRHCNANNFTVKYS